MGADGKNRDHVIDLMRQSRVRWLKNTEVCDILYNHRAYDFVLSPNAPVRPQGARGNRQISFSSPPACRNDGPGSSRGGANFARGARGGARARRLERAARLARPAPERIRDPARAPRSTPHPARLPAPPPHSFAALLLVCHADHPAPRKRRNPDE